MNKKNTGARKVEADFFDRMWQESWTYIKTVVDVVREPVLILDKSFKVMAGNEPFYRTFQVEQKDTEGKKVYDLGNGQWDIPELRKLLENILPRHTFFKGFEVAHEFPFIGRKIMILNARQIYFRDDARSNACPPIILLAIEDVTEMISVAEKLSGHLGDFENRLTKRTERLELNFEKLIRDMRALKRK